MVQHSDSFSKKHAQLRVEITKIAKIMKIITDHEKHMIDFVTGKKNRALFQLTNKNNSRHYNLNLQMGSHWIDSNTQKPKGYGLVHWLEGHYGAGARSEISARDILNFPKNFVNARMMTVAECEHYDTLGEKEGFIRIIGEFNIVMIISKHPSLPHNQWGSITYFKEKVQVLADLS